MFLKQRQKTSIVTAHLLLRGCGASDLFITALRSSISENVHTLYKSLTNTIVAYLHQFILFLHLCKPVCKPCLHTGLQYTINYTMEVICLGFPKLDNDQSNITLKYLCKYTNGL